MKRLLLGATKPIAPSCPWYEVSHATLEVIIGTCSPSGIHCVGKTHRSRSFLHGQYITEGEDVQKILVHHVAQAELQDSGNYKIKLSKAVSFPAPLLLGGFYTIHDCSQ